MSEPVQVRVFGSDSEDLDLDFDTHDVPSLVTALLARCLRDSAGHARTADHWWALPLGERIALLLTILEAGDASDLELVLDCAACAERIEVALPLRALVEHQRAARPEVEARRDGRTIRLRRPTGEDLQRWSTELRSGDTAAFVQALIVDGERELDAEWLTVIEAALADSDPLVDFKVVTRCPACDAPHEADVDLQPLICRRLKGAQSTLLDEIHRLALAYHWSEAELVAMPAGRRGQYLARLDRLGQ